MITWITGESGSGKTTLAKKLLTDGKTVHLDGDAMRTCWTLGFSKEDRFENNLRIAKIAKVINDQGFDVVVSTICPYEELKEQVYFICKCRFIKVEGKYTA